MTTAIRPLELALKGLEKAKGIKGLEGKVTAVQEATEQTATALRAVTPPPSIAKEQTDLLIALQRVSGVLGHTANQVEGRQLCTGLAARSKVGDEAATADLRSALTALKAKLPGTTLDLTLPAAGQKNSARPSNGKLLRSGNRNGRGTLSINNHGGDDALIVLTKGKKQFVSVYVRHGKKYTVTGIPDGSYTAYYSGGDGWDAKARSFTRDCSFERFNDPIAYKTITTATQIRWSTWKIDLDQVSTGPDPTSDVKPDDFPED